jgi:hypothetical protein
MKRSYPPNTEVWCIYKKILKYCIVESYSRNGYYRLKPTVGEPFNIKKQKVHLLYRDASFTPFQSILSALDNTDDKGL